MTAFSAAVVIVALALCLSVLVFQFWTGVPLMSSSDWERADVIHLLSGASLAPEAVIYDLGSGWGALVLSLAEAYPCARIRGIEMSPLPYWVSCWRTRNLPNVQLRRGNFLSHDLADANAVTCFLMMRSMPEIARLLDKTLKPSTPVVSLCFWFRDRQIVASRFSGGALSGVAMYRWSTLPLRSAQTAHGAPDCH